MSGYYKLANVRKTAQLLQKPRPVRGYYKMANVRQNMAVIAASIKRGPTSA